MSELQEKRYVVVWPDGCERDFASLEEARQWVAFLTSVPIDDGPVVARIVEYTITRIM